MSEAVFDEVRCNQREGPPFDKLRANERIGDEAKTKSP